MISSQRALNVAHQTQNCSDRKATIMGRLTYALVAAGAAAGVAVAPLALGAIGFTSVGIAAGSYAASMMSAAAIANGGGVAAGSTVAILQAAGMAGLSTTATAAVASAGGAVAAAVASAARNLNLKKRFLKNNLQLSNTKFNN